MPNVTGSPTFSTITTLSIWATSRRVWLPEAARQPTWGPRTQQSRGLSSGRRSSRSSPVVKEELAVRKRAAERRYRIRTYTVETPVEEQVRLRDERVIVERRLVTSTAGAGVPDAARDREFEIVERHEEPVIEKRARPVEEVVVRREANDRVETVRDTVRETRVDIDKDQAEHRVGAGSSTPTTRKP